MKNKLVYISFIILLICIFLSYFKINYYIQKNEKNNKNIVRSGKNVKEGDILYVNGNKEIVIKVLEDGTYITKIVK